VPIEVDGDLLNLRLDPGEAPGRIDVQWIALHRGGPHPIEVAAVQQTDTRLTVGLKNHGEKPITAAVNGNPIVLEPGLAVRAPIALAGRGPLEAVVVRVEVEGLPPVERHVWVYRADAPVACVARETADLRIAAARDGSLVRIVRDGQPVAAIAPLVHVDYRLPKLRLISTGDSGPLRWEGDGVTAVVEISGDGTLAVSIASDKRIEGPVVRVLGGLEQGLFAGVEYLGKGERSSSKLDIETDESLRVQPDPRHVTMPLMTAVTGRASVALAWDDMTLQPVFATPDFLDGRSDHRMSLEGKNIRCVLRIGAGWEAGGRLEDAILWAVRRHGLPELAQRPRGFAQQMALSLRAYSGMVHDAQHGGWFHAVVPGTRRGPERGAYFADHASSIWRITGQMPEVPKLQFGGAHVYNPAGFFVTGGAADWARIARVRADAMVRQQQPDGSYRYDGQYRRGHFENTASGICARPAFELLEHAYYTGDKRSLDAGLKTLAYMKRFRTPRGAQTWEVPLHTPDILASAYLVWAYVRGYELTGQRHWLDEARRWAISGLPFVYQWSDRPIMLYATTPVYGATHWVAPNWIGRPVQWCGLVYAYSLLLLAPHDATLDWRKLAEGILLCGEQMQYPDGPSVGCLPDAFELPTQRRVPSDINPSTLVSLRLLVDGKLDALARAADGRHTVVGPYPITIRDGKARITAAPGVKYQVLLDGTRVRDVQSTGEDVLSVD
jgi:hypothetical protein